jgi:apolipoprotein D and lipocalin family protein
MQKFRLHPLNFPTWLITGMAVCVAVCGTTPALAADKLPPLKAINKPLDMDRFAGDWHVVASIPVGIPFFDDGEAFNYTESYEIMDDGRVKMTCEFNEGSFEGERKTFSFKAKSKSESNAEWDVQFVWPLSARYMVIHLDENYENVIVAVPSRRWAWIMSRGPDINETQYDSLINILASNGFDIAKVRRIPHAPLTG